MVMDFEGTSWRWCPRQTWWGCVKRAMKSLNLSRVDAWDRDQYLVGLCQAGYEEFELVPGGCCPGRVLEIEINEHWESTGNWLISSWLLKQLYVYLHIWIVFISFFVFFSDTVNCIKWLHCIFSAVDGCIRIYIFLAVFIAVMMHVQKLGSCW